MTRLVVVSNPLSSETLKVILCAVPYFATTFADEV